MATKTAIIEVIFKHELELVNEKVTTWRCSDEFALSDSDLVATVGERGIVFTYSLQEIIHHTTVPMTEIESFTEIVM
jgi:hypothetical protein